MREMARWSVAAHVGFERSPTYGAIGRVDRMGLRDDLGMVDAFQSKYGDEGMKLLVFGEGAPLGRELIKPSWWRSTIPGRRRVQSIDVR